MRDVDDPVLLPDRLDRVGEAHPAGDLLAEEEPDHLALAVGLHLLARDHDQVAIAGELDRLEGAGEDVVVGDRDRAEALLLGVIDQRPRVDRAVVRPVGVHVQVDHDPVALAEATSVGVVCGRRPAPLADLLVDMLEPLRERGRSPPRAPVPASRCPSASAGRRRRAGGRPPPQPAPAGWRRRQGRRWRNRTSAPRAGAARFRPVPARRSPPRRGSCGVSPASRASGCGRAGAPRPGSSGVASAGRCGRGRPPSPAPP